jgi:hypothetical protein
MTQSYLRQINLVVATASGSGLDFGNFRCTFTVRRGDGQTPNSLDARIYNVSDATANTISKNEFTTISLSAGYPGGVGLLFRGNIVQFRKGRVNQLDSYVDITAADGDEAYNYAFMSTTVPANTTQGSIRDLIQSSFARHSGSQAITAGYAPQFPQNTSIRGEVFCGMTRNICRNFADQNNCKWSFDNGALTFIPWNSYSPGTIPEISVNTGLIGVPEQTQAGINIRTLLNPAIKVGQLIQLKGTVNRFRFGLDLPSTATNGAVDQINPVTGQTESFGLAAQIKTNSQGLYYVLGADHTGDTRGQNWYTDLTCLAVDATIANQDPIKALFNTAPASQVIQRYGGT